MVYGNKSTWICKSNKQAPFLGKKSIKITCKHLRNLLFSNLIQITYYYLGYMERQTSKPRTTVIHYRIGWVNVTRVYLLYSIALRTPATFTSLINCNQVQNEARMCMYGSKLKDRAFRIVRGSRVAFRWKIGIV